MDEVERKIIWAVFNFELVEENSQHLRCGHAAVDTDISDRTERRREHGCLQKNKTDSSAYIPV